MKQSQCNAGGRHCARMRGVWQPVVTVIPAPIVNRESRGTLRQFVVQSCEVEPGSTVGPGDSYGARSTTGAQPTGLIIARRIRKEAIGQYGLPNGAITHPASKWQKNHQDAARNGVKGYPGSSLGITKVGFEDGTISLPLHELIGCRVVGCHYPETDRKLLVVRTSG